MPFLYVSLQVSYLFPFSGKHTIIGCTSNHILIIEVARLKDCCLIKHCEKIVHLTHHSTLQICHATPIHNNNLVALTKDTGFVQIKVILSNFSTAHRLPNVFQQR